MINLDGGYGSGGGQIVRTSIGLSALTGKAIKITNIRKGRCREGLAEQHLQSVRAIAKICDAKVKGAKLHSTEIEFIPGKIKSGNVNVRISTAGSVGLLLQAMLIPAIKKDIVIKVDGGGTYGKWAAPIDNFRYVLFPLLEKMGYKVEMNVEREGFYPVGGAKVKVHSYKAELKPIELIDKGDIVSVEGRSIASEHLKKAEVAERQAKAAKKIIFDKLKVDAKIKKEYVKSDCPGSGIQLWIKTKNTVIGANALGEKGKRSEQVGEEAAENLVEGYNRGCVDRHTADQLIPYMALAGRGKILASEISGHVKTNAYITEQFLPVKFKIRDNLIDCQKT
ncbi:MAG: RNA 3'-terminal phosphate cyclase [Nanoarchaeota archaeon]|nr:RNA 3'-terminal phosphate cyclase [Nanoarchaeota archaeon]MCG2718907.1 RNA 3'-terminal phosphate cyclase [Nanoarchaeota archaeon]